MCVRKLALNSWLLHLRKLSGFCIIWTFEEIFMVTTIDSRKEFYVIAIAGAFRFTDYLFFKIELG